jgi:hypothetical protein
LSTVTLAAARQTIPPIRIKLLARIMVALLGKTWPTTRGFHGPFFGLRNFCCKTAQVCTTRRETEMLKQVASAAVRKPVKTHAKVLLWITNQLAYPPGLSVAELAKLFAWGLATLHFLRFGLSAFSVPLPKTNLFARDRMVVF